MKWKWQTGFLNRENGWNWRTGFISGPGPTAKTTAATANHIPIHIRADDPLSKLVLWIYRGIETWWKRRND